jgi:hypothetical protein
MRLIRATPALCAVTAAGLLGLAACGQKAAAPAASQAPPVAAGVGAQPSVQQLEATALADEARAKQLEAQAQASQAQAGQPPPSPAAGPSAAGTQTLGPGDQTLQTGQYYKAIPIPMQAGDVYQVNYVAHGYTPSVLVLDQDKQPFSQTSAGPQLAPGQPLSTEIRPDKPGTWYVVLTAAAPGASGTFEVNVQKITETPAG